MAQDQAQVPVLVAPLPMAGPHRPQKRAEAEAAERESRRREINEHVHVLVPARRARGAFVVTRIDEPDIASAAISGVA